MEFSKRFLKHITKHSGLRIIKKLFLLEIFGNKSIKTLQLKIIEE